MKTVLLYSGRKDDLEFVTAVAETGECLLVQTSNEAEFVDELKRSESTLIFVDLSTTEQLAHFQALYHDILREAPRAIRASAVHVFVNDAIDRLDSLTASNIFAHLVIRKYESAAKAGADYGRMLLETEIQRRGRRASECSAIDMKVIRLSHSGERRKALEFVEEFLQSHAALRERVTNIMINAVDELLMNAFFDATEHGEWSFTPRDVEVELPRDKIVELQIRLDGETVSFTVVDSYGSVDRRKLLNCVLSGCKAKAEGRRALHANLSPTSGAEVGLATVFRMGGSFSYYVKRGERTEATVRFKKTNDYLEFRKQIQSISIHSAAA